ncbi:hypothetical protein GCM10025790_08050 [Nesterenkonia rhizosphaerae]|uniref:Uncharacterized protein n=1 Tax=Nesterenkonia rhizosphaerae TaxID=1348272 RepID=A0ABP9FTE4_9MICC
MLRNPDLRRRRLLVSCDKLTRKFRWANPQASGGVNGGECSQKGRQPDPQTPDASNSAAPRAAALSTS